MKVKNISGNTLTFKAGGRTYVVANNASQTVDDTVEALNDVIMHMGKNRLELVTPPPVANYSGAPARYGYADVSIGTLHDTYTFVVNSSQIFEWDNNNSVSGTHTKVAMGNNAAASAANLKTAINQNSTLTNLGLVAEDIVDTGADVKLILKAKGSVAIADIPLSQTGGAVTITKVASSEGDGYRTSTVTVTAAAKTVLINTGLASIYNVFVAVRDSGGVAKAFDGAIKKGGGFIYLDDSGSVDLASGDVITVVAVGK